jgi:glutamate dehydrogenase/leucine dehydrogenase
MVPDWKRKLSSRKLWAGVISFITALLTAFNVNNLTIEQITVIISGIGALCVYMLAEAKADSNNKS